MIYRFDIDRWGAEFSVPYSVVNEHIKQADGNFVKVLLCILAGGRNSDTQTISRTCGVAESEVDDAVLYWQQRGVISFNSNAAQPAVSEIPQPVRNAPQPSGSFSERNEPVSLVEAVKVSKNAPAGRVVVNYSQREIKEKAEKDKNLRQLITDIQGILKFSINGKELGRLVELYELYHFDVPTILLAAQYCSSIGKHSVAYLYAVMQRWFEEDINSYAEVEQAIIKSNEIKSFENKVLKIFGMESKPSSRQKEYISKWNKLGFSVELLEIAYNKCMDAKGKLNFSYIDGILMNWSNSSISTAEQVRKSDEKYKSKFNGWDKNSSEEKSSYDLDEYENFAMNFSLSSNGSEGSGNK